MKLCYVAIHDYGTGSAGIKVFARSIDEVTSVLRGPEWKVYAPDETGHLRHLERLPESDIDERSQLLQTFIEIGQQHVKGKTAFIVRDRAGEVRHVWARSVGEILDSFPKLLILSSVSSEITGYSDIDKPDGFLQRNAIDGSQT
ncbi:hypothetical protein [Pseudohongiella spirulinae]|uniref:Uncharacterized protein n=1 Tax=Pseudohongiella spirulinae TaxID=1249552 RepID=A0A0S2KA84_9GAMM|nr:hypothetical protein [Pseudohongiella spirulinae]ALO44895.1 hypothetical protein PS2015_201 [Pseudohongiella spirulinae]